MRFVVFSGTTEGRDFSRAAAALGIAVTVSVATDLGAEEQGQAPGITVHSGRLLPGAMAELLQGAALCVDATHPYAVEATKNIRAAANAAGVEYHRLLRAASTLPAGSVVLGSAAQAAQYLAATQGNVLLTTGAKELAAFAGLDAARLYPRVLPTHEGLAACEAAGVASRRLLGLCHGAGRGGRNGHHPSGMAGERHSCLAAEAKPCKSHDGGGGTAPCRGEKGGCHARCT